MLTFEPGQGAFAPESATRGFTGAPLTNAASALEGVWSAVQVTTIDTHRAVEGGGMQVVHARVHLGALLPLDVVVELECLGAARDDETSSWRMWCDHPQGAGNFVFEARLPDAALAGTATLGVRVSPAPDSPTDSSRMRPAELTVPLARPT
jgi:hypothetical protein